jgi:hypothetical protein
MRAAGFASIVLLGCGQQMMMMDAGMTCSVAAKTPPNLAPNGSFECGDPTTAFKALGTGATVTVGTGRTGAGLTFKTSSTIFGNRFGSEWKVVADTAATYCINAWMKSTSSATTLRLFGTTPNSGTATGQQFDMPGPLTIWSKVPPNVKLDVAVRAGDEVSVSIEDKSNTAGTTIDVDDLDLWISPDGRCQETR